MKKILSILLLVALTLSAFSICASADARPFEGATVEFASFWNEAEEPVAWLKDYCAKWEEISGAKVNITYYGRDLLTAIKSDILLGNSPDVINQDINEIFGALVTADEVLLEPMNDLLDKCAYGDDVPLKDIVQAQNLCTYDGNYYGVPWANTTAGFFYNKTLFNSLGLTVPKTWDEFITVCETLNANDIPAIAADGNISFYNAYYFCTLCQRILGVNAFHEAAFDATGAAWDNEGFLKAAELVYELSEGGKNLFAEGYQASAYPAGQSDWALGNAGLLFCGNWIPLETADLIDDDWDWGFFAFPEIEGGAGDQTSMESQPYVFSIPKGAKNVEAAKDLIMFLMSIESMDAQITAAPGTIAARAGIIFPEPLADAKVFLEASQSSFRTYDGVMADAPEWWANVFYPADDALFYGKLTPAEFIAQVKAETIQFYANK